MKRPGRVVTAALLLCLAAAGAQAGASPNGERGAEAEAPLLLGNEFPVGVSISFHKALLHWLDSLVSLSGAGYTAGKTVAGHRHEYQGRFGLPSEADREMLKSYHAARRSFVDRAGTGSRDRLTLAFFEAPNLDDALLRAEGLLDAGTARDLATAMRHFEERYRRIWEDGRIPRGFLARSLSSPRRKELGRFLAGVARWFAVSSRPGVGPELVVVPVPAGYGTHAQAIGRFLLIEIRPEESLWEQAAPIIHENVHFLFYAIPPPRRVELERAALAAGPRGAEAWHLLREALPTAIAQGVAEQSFRGRHWSRKQPWYHTRPVDRYAKRIFPLVKRGLGGEAAFDATFVERLVQAYR